MSWFSDQSCSFATREGAAGEVMFTQQVNMRGK